jgi:hypothetical protein
MNGEGKRILIVEDDPGLLFTMTDARGRDSPSRGPTTGSKRSGGSTAKCSTWW